jgi:aminoglycoside 3-N-acetyltransferase
LLSRAKQYIKARVKRARRRFVETFRAFSPPELARELAALGIRAGDTILVHSSYDSFRGFTGKPTDVIAVLQGAVGPTGNLLMPTLPFDGTAVDYVRSNPVFDVRRTPSRMGLLTELFRRSPDVLRSVHPTHPVAAWGRDAAGLVDSHHLAATPCGKGSPFARLLDCEGKILILGAGIGVMTFYHTIEELLEKKLPFSPFGPEVFVLHSRDYSGNLVATNTRLFDPAVSRRRNLQKLAPELRRNRVWRQGRVGQLRMIALEAERVLSTVNDMTARGIYCYD